MAQAQALAAYRQPLATGGRLALSLTLNLHEIPIDLLQRIPLVLYLGNADQLICYLRLVSERDLIKCRIGLQHGAVLVFFLETNYYFN